jgi:hypothetical protein
MGFLKKKVIFPRINSALSSDSSGIKYDAKNFESDNVRFPVLVADTSGRKIQTVQYPPSNPGAK